MRKLFLWTLLLALLGTSGVALADTTSVLLIPARTGSAPSEIYMFDPFNGDSLGLFIPDDVNGTFRHDAISGPDGNIYVSVLSPAEIRVYDRSGNFLYIYADVSDGLTSIRCIKFRGDHLFVQDGARVVEFNGPHSPLGDFINDGSAPQYFYFLEDGRCLVSDGPSGSNSIRLYNADGTFAQTVISLTNPWQIREDPQLPGPFLNIGYGTGASITDFDLDGTIHNTISNNGIGIFRLGNGNLLMTRAAGTSTSGVIEITNAGDTVDVQISGKKAWFIELCTVDTGGATCDYIPGDCDHNDISLELSDVVAMIGMYRGTQEPYYTCDCPPHGSDFAPEADPNGNCVAFELGDVVTEIAAYRGTAEASGCPDCPGTLRLVQPGEVGRSTTPTLRSKSGLKESSNKQ